MSYPLYVDYRAGSVDLLKYMPDDLAEKTTLEFGDAMIVGNGPTSPMTIGVEVKSIADVLSSANTGRLAGHQLPGLLATYDVPYLLYFGSYRPGEKGELEVRRGQAWQNFRLGLRPVPYGYLENFLMDVASTGCRLKHVYNSQEAAIWLMCLHRWWSKPWNQHKGLKQFDCSKDGSLLPGLPTHRELMARVASQLPGIGFDRAVAVSAKFGSIQEMVNAEVADWQSIPGIGKVIAKSVWATIRQTAGG